MKPDCVPHPYPKPTGPMGHPVLAPAEPTRPSSLCRHSGRYLGYAMAGVEEDGRVGVHEAIFEGEEPLGDVISVITGETCGQEGAWRGQRTTWPPEAQALLLTPPHLCPAGGSPS